MLLLVIFVRGGQVYSRSPFYQSSPSQALRQDSNGNANNFITGVSNDFRTYDPASSRFATVAPTRASALDPQKSFANFTGSGRYSTYVHWLANSSSTGFGATRLSYLAPTVSQPKTYYWGQEHTYIDPTKDVYNNQVTHGLVFYRLSDGNKVILDQIFNDNWHWLYYNQINRDDNLLTLSNAGEVSKIETASEYQDRTDTPSTPLLFQTHGGIGADGGGTMRTDYSRDSNWQASDRDNYIIYRPNFGSNIQLPADVETLGEWGSNTTGQRSGS